LPLSRGRCGHLDLTKTDAADNRHPTASGRRNTEAEIDDSSERGLERLDPRGNLAVGLVGLVRVVQLEDVAHKRRARVLRGVGDRLGRTRSSSPGFTPRRTAAVFTSRNLSSSFRCASSTLFVFSVIALSALKVSRV